MCRHLEILSVRSANLPAGEGVAFLGRNVANYNIGIEVVDISADYLSVNLVGYVVLVDAELSIETNGLRRHGELAGSSIDGYNIRDIRPAGKGIAFLFRMSGSYGYVSAEGVGIDAFKLRVDILLILIEVGHLGIDRNPLCVQIQLGHQKMIRANFILGTVNIPAAEGVAVRNGKHILANDMGIAGGSGYNLVSCAHAGDSAIVRVISYSNRNTGNVAVNVVAIFLGLILDGVPYNSNVVVYIKVGAQYRERISGIGSLVVGCAIFRPVARGEETEVSRRNQIVVVAKAVNVVDTVGRVIVGAMGISNRPAFRSQRACVAGSAVSVLYAAVRLAIRQIVRLVLACAALRSAARRQKYEILSVGQIRFRRSRGSNRGAVVNPLRVQSQVVVRHGFAFPLVLELCIGVPAAEVKTSLLNCRRGNRLIGIIRTFGGVRASFAREFAAVFVIGQLVRIYVRLDINLNGSVLLGLDPGKVKAELEFIVSIVYLAEIVRLEHYTVDGVIGIIANLTDTNRRNRKGLVVPELPGGENLTVMDAAINDDLIGHAAAITIVCIFLVNRPVGNVNLNHLRIFSANQIVEYQLVGQSEFSPLVRALGKVLKLAILVSNVGNFGTELGLVIVRPGALVMQ